MAKMLVAMEGLSTVARVVKENDALRTRTKYVKAYIATILTEI